MKTPDRKPGASKLDTDQRLAAMRRLEAGEKQRAVAADTGVTSQYISLLWRAYKDKGVEGILDKKTGPRPARELTAAEEEKIRSLLLAHPKPSGLGLPVSEEHEDVWTLPLVRKLAKRELDFTPMRDHIKDLLRKWNFRLPDPLASRELEFSEDYYEYLKSPLAKQIREREKIAAEKWEQERAAKWGKPVGEEEPEFDSDDYEKLRLKMENQQGIGEIESRQRTGKHSKGGAPTQKKKRRKKR